MLVRLMKEPYEQEYFEQCKFIWKNYVPKNGQSGILQGELLRIVEKLRCEAQDNGNVNWDYNFEYLCNFLLDTLCSQEIYNENEKESYKQILNYFIKCGNYAIAVYNKKADGKKIDMESVAYINDNLY